MKNKLAYAIALVATLHSPFSAALRLGDIVVDSNVNEPLSATIELGSAKGVAAERILVQMASAADFRKANIEKPYHLNDISFKIEQGSNGKVLRLTSSKKITEPYLNFILDTRWPNGRFLREYLVLLDLPIHSSATGNAIQQSSTSKLASSVSHNSVRDPLVETEARPVAASTQAQYQASVNKSATSGNQQYRVRANDTLWNIADQHRARAASVEQSMHALFESNPHAFMDANINQLKKGAVLRIPSEEEQTSVAHQQAKSWQKNQYAEWKKSRALPSNLKQSLDASMPDQSVASNGSKSDGHLTLTTNLKSEQHQARAEKSLADVLTDNPSSEQNAPTADNLVSTLEQLDRKSLEHEALQDRYANLQERFGQLEKLIALKNTQLAELTASIQKSEDILEELEDSSPQQGPATIDDSIAPEYLSVADAGEAADSRVELNDESSLAEGQIDSELTSEQLAVAALAAKAAPTGSPVTPEGAPPEPPAPATPPPVSETGVAAIIQQITSSLPAVVTQNLQWIAAGFGALLVSVLGLFAFLRKRSSDAADEGEIDAEFLEQLEASEEELTFANQKLSPHQWSTDVEEPKALGSEDIDGAESASSNMQGDQLAEIDIFLAYGRHDKAIEALDNLIDNEAQNVEYRLKLIEAYIAQGSNDAAQAEANTVLELAPELESKVNALLDSAISDSAEIDAGASEISETEALDLTAEDTGEGKNLDSGNETNTQSSQDAGYASEAEDLSASIDSLDSQLSGQATADVEIIQESDSDPLSIDLDSSLSLNEFDLASDSEDLQAATELSASAEGVGGSGSYEDQIDSVSDLDFAQSFSEIEEQPVFQTVDGNEDVELDSLELDVGDEFAISGSDSLLDTGLDLDASIDDALSGLELDTSLESTAELNVSGDIEPTTNVPLTEDQQLEQDIAAAYGDVGDELLNDSDLGEEEFADEDFGVDSADTSLEISAENSQDIVDSLIERIDESLESPSQDVSSSVDELNAVDNSESDALELDASDDLGVNAVTGADQSQNEQLSDADLEAEYQSASEMLEQMMGEPAEQDESTIGAQSDNELVSESGEEAEGLNAEKEGALNEEVATKLDLARAYLEMGDIDGAKDVLDEVLEEGSSDQQQEANQMLQKIA